MKKWVTIIEGLMVDDRKMTIGYNIQIPEAIERFAVFWLDQNCHQIACIGHCGKIGALKQKWFDKIAIILLV